MNSKYIVKYEYLYDSMCSFTQTREELIAHWNSVREAHIGTWLEVEVDYDPLNIYSVTEFKKINGNFNITLTEVDFIYDRPETSTRIN